MLLANDPAVTHIIQCAVPRYAVTSDYLLKEQLDIILVHLAAKKSYGNKNELSWECHTRRYTLRKTDNLTDKMFENLVGGDTAQSILDPLAIFSK